MFKEMFIRVMKIKCPECQADAKISKTNRKHPQLSDLYCACSNIECGHTFVMNVSFSHTLSPSALKGQGRIKELIDAMPECEREQAIALLTEAKEKSRMAYTR